MTSPAEPASSDATQASQVTKPLRELAALVLLGANAVLLFVSLLRLLLPLDGYGTFTDRAGSTHYGFVGVEAVVLPLLAVLLATHVRPTLARAKLITQVALAEYAFAALFGVLTFLVWLVGRLADAAVLDAFLGMLSRLAGLAILGIAAFVVFRIWRTLYFVPRPKPQPGMYGQPQPGWPQQPGGYPGQPGGPGGYPGQPGGYPGAGAPQPGHPVPGQYGHPQSAPPFNTAPPHTPQSGPPYAAPQSGPPYGAPQPAPPFGQPPSADPTQAIPRQPAEPAPQDGDRTERFDRDDPNHPR
ncbi:CvpA family protein [Micromonospora sp. HK10]|uniref:CvpA family protein n=1 Tax=Micromonospora sp. HK10 TaxID=1538294 RepID=UPI000626FA02|nr:CvpA family protein [Micromonospora sp. HK10]KKK06711.1 hypothetical protein LQ51_07080 [Micromonospora sp. HK10]